MPDSARLAAVALAAARGWHVFPLRPDDRPADPDHAKKPAFPDHGEDRCTGRDPRCRAGHTGWEPRATTDPDRIARAWQRAPFGAGIACGPSGLVVVDLDVPKPGQVPPAGTAPGVVDGGDVFAELCEAAGQPFPNTYTVATGRGGLHLYFAHPRTGTPLRNTQGDRGRGLGWLVDTRAHGGYVVAAGSTVSGLPYTVLHDTVPAELPAWLADRLRSPAPATSRAGRPVAGLPADRAGRYVRGAIDGTLAKLAEAAEGSRNHALFMAAQSLGQLAAGGALTETTITDALTPAALAMGLSARETARTIRSGLTAGARRPRAVAA